MKRIILGIEIPLYFNIDNRIRLIKDIRNGVISITIYEEWRWILNYENEYKVSSLGRIKSMKYGKERILKTKGIRHGYPFFVLSVNGKKYNKSIHRCVAISFIPNPNNLPYINHLDGRKINRIYLNLKWCSASENQLHSYRLGLNKGSGESRTGDKNWCSRKILQYTKDGLFIQSFNAIVFASKKFNIPATSISAVARGKNKTTGGFIWKYADNL